MNDRHDWESPDAIILTHALEKLRARDGLTLARLQAGRSGEAGPLFRLAATQRHATAHGVDVDAAVLDVIRECIRETIDPTRRIVADAILATGVFTEEYLAHGIERRAVDQLRAHSLGTRRTALLSHWRRLHMALGADAPAPPSDRTLRGTTEREVLKELARQLIRREVYSIGSRHALRPTYDGQVESGTGLEGRVIVIGGAVMDATFRTKLLPQLASSSEAYGFNLTPGGKGLNQAVALARLGLDVSLIAAVADDRFGNEIVDYLRAEEVDTSMIKWVPHARTPFVGIIEMELGDSVAVNWRNQLEIHLDIRDIDQHASRLTTCDAVLLTFEVPRETLQHALAVAHTARETRPMVIVTPGQPYPDDGISAHALTQIDYLVAHNWELSRYSLSDEGPFDPDSVAQRLLAYGVGTLCLLSGAGCTVYSPGLEILDVPAIPSIYKERQAARDAFCAALAAKLLDNSRAFSPEVTQWATVAMSCATADFPLSNSMPDRRRIEQLLARSRFTV